MKRTSTLRPVQLVQLSSERTCQSPPHAAALGAGLVLSSPSETAPPQMRSSGWNNPFELQKANAPPNPFISGSCNKHLTSSELLSPPTFVKGMLSIHRLGRHVRSRRIESEEEERMQSGSKLPVIHSNASSALLLWLSLANVASSRRFQKRKKKKKALQSEFSLLPTAGRSYWQPIRVEGARKTRRVKRENNFCGSVSCCSDRRQHFCTTTRGAEAMPHFPGQMESASQWDDLC